MEKKKGLFIKELGYFLRDEWRSSVAEDAGLQSTLGPLSERAKLPGRQMLFLGFLDWSWYFLTTLMRCLHLVGDDLHSDGAEEPCKLKSLETAYLTCARKRECIYWVYLTMIKICNSNNNYINALKRWTNGILPVTTLVVVHCWIFPLQPRTTELQYDCHDTLSNQSQKSILLWLFYLKPPCHTDQRTPRHISSSWIL